jgi:hypothetical protein
MHDRNTVLAFDAHPSATKRAQTDTKLGMLGDLGIGETGHELGAPLHDRIYDRSSLRSQLRRPSVRMCDAPEDQTITTTRHNEEKTSSARRIRQ